MQAEQHSSTYVWAPTATTHRRQRQQPVLVVRQPAVLLAGMGHAAVQKPCELVG